MEGWTCGLFFKVEAIFRIFGILSKLKIAHFGFFKQDESCLNRSTKKYKTSNVIEVDEFIYRNREGLVRGRSVQFVRVDGKIYSGWNRNGTVFEKICFPVNLLSC